MADIDTRDDAPLSEEQMEALATQIRDAYESGDMQAVAAQIAVPFGEAVEYNSLADTILDQNDEDPSDDTTFYVTDELTAFVLNPDGTVGFQEIHGQVVTCPPVAVDASFQIPMRLLRKGQYGEIALIMANAGKKVAEKKDEHIFNLVRASIQADFEVESSGGALDKDALVEAMGVLEDLNMKPERIYMRGARNVDVMGFAFSEATKAEIDKSGVSNLVISGARIVNTTKLPAGEIIIKPQARMGRILREFTESVDWSDMDSKMRKGRASEEFRAAIWNKRFVRITVTS